MGFMKRRVMDRVAKNVTDAYWQEADRQRGLARSYGVQPDADMILKWHGQAWRHSMKTVFKTREYGPDGSHVLGGAETGIYDTLAESLCMATGVLFADVAAAAALRARSDLIIRAWVDLEHLEKQEALLMDEQRQRQDVRAFLVTALNAYPRGADNQVDLIRVQFTLRYPTLL